jgi:hypothetical protein
VLYFRPMHALISEVAIELLVRFRCRFHRLCGTLPPVPSWSSVSHRKRNGERTSTVACMFVLTRSRKACALLPPEMINSRGKGGMQDHNSHCTVDLSPLPLSPSFPPFLLLLRHAPSWHAVEHVRENIFATFGAETRLLSQSSSDCTILSKRIIILVFYIVYDDFQKQIGRCL